MNFALEPQNFSGKNWNSPINIGPASLFTAITYNVNSFALYAPSDATLSGSSATEIQFQGSNDGINCTVLYSTTTTCQLSEREWPSGREINIDDLTKDGRFLISGPR